MQEEKAQASTVSREADLRSRACRLQRTAIISLVLGVVCFAVGWLAEPDNVPLVAIGAAILAQGGLTLRLSPILRRLIDEAVPRDESMRG